MCLSSCTSPTQREPQAPDASTSDSSVLADVAGMALYPYRGVIDRETNGTYDRITAAGFNLIDSSPATIGDVNGTTEKAYVWVGNYDKTACDWEVSDQQLTSYVQANIGNPKIAAWYISDEPPPSCDNVYAEHKARSDLIHGIDPNATTLIVIDGNSGQQTLDQLPKWANIADYIGIDAYICWQGHATCSYSWIDTIGQAAAAAGPGLRLWAIPQAYGENPGEGAYMCTTTGCGLARLPTAAEIHEQFDHWRATKMTGYIVFAWHWAGYGAASSLWLENRPELQAQLAIENNTPMP
jgi:hypothetical protein